MRSPDHTQTVAPADHEIERFIPLDQQREAALAFAQATSDLEVQSWTQAALAEIQTAMGGIPLLAVGVTDYWNGAFIPEQVVLSAPTAPAGLSTLVPAEPVVSYVDETLQERILTDDYRIDYHSLRPVFIYTGERVRLGEGFTLPFWITYTGGYEIGGSRLPTFLELIKTYLGVRATSDPLTALRELRKLFLSQLHHLALAA